MADLRLSFAMSPWDRVLPLINGEVKPDGITLDYVGMPGGGPRVIYDQIKFQRYDVSEMSVSSALRMRSIGWRYRLLPVFHERQFGHTMVQVRLSSGIRQGHPEDLKGKRIGLKDYPQSGGLWTRGILEMEFGVKPGDMVWFQERGEHFSHLGAAAALGLAPPPTVELHYAGTDLATMLLKGELDAVFGLRTGGAPASGIDRGQISVSGNPDIVTLFPDPHREAVRFYKKTGVFPPDNTTVVRESILEEHPWVGISLMEAFDASKRIAIERLRRSPPSLMVFGGHFLKEVDSIFGADPYPYGVKPNANTIDMMQTFLVQQGLTQCKQPLEEIFPAGVFYREERWQ